MTPTKYLHAYAAALWLYVVWHHVWAYTGHFGYDDMYYAKIAEQWSRGIVPIANDHYAYRWTLLAPTALAYRLVGVNDTASGAAALLASSLTLAMLVWLLRRQVWAAAAAASLWLFDHWTLYYSDKLMPDCWVATATLAAVAVLYYHRQGRLSDGRAAWAWVICLLVGFCAKESIWLTVPMWLYALLGDLLTRQRRRFWAYASGVGLAVLGAYFALIAYHTGSPWYRFYAIQHNSYFMPLCSYHQLPWAILIDRLTVGFPAMLLRHSMIVPLVGMLPALLAVKKQGLHGWLAGMAAAATAGAWWFSTSLEHYMPMCLDPRHYLYLVPLWAWVAGTVVDRLVSEGAYRWYFVGAMGGLSLWAAYLQHDVAYWVYAPVWAWTVVVAVYHHFFKPNNTQHKQQHTESDDVEQNIFYLNNTQHKQQHTESDDVEQNTFYLHNTQHKQPTSTESDNVEQNIFYLNNTQHKQPTSIESDDVEQNIFYLNNTQHKQPTSTAWARCAAIAILAAALALYPTAQGVFSGTKRAYATQKALMEQYFVAQKTPFTLISDEVAQRFGEYYEQFALANGHCYTTFAAVRNGASINLNGKVYVMVAGSTQWLAGGSWESYPTYVRQPPPSMLKVYDDGQSIAIFEVTNVADLQQ